MRLVASAHGYVAFCAFAGRQPYEMWILPERHEAWFDAVPDSDLPGVAIVLIEALERLSLVCEQSNYKLAYNLVLHTAPFDQDHTSSYHWHWELIPRVTHLAGLELGAGVHINPISPERAAQNLRGASPSVSTSIIST
jgi:UDPglucose--hexose-1-phosphate uridylyltransferase